MIGPPEAGARCPSKLTGSPGVSYAADRDRWAASTGFAGELAADLATPRMQNRSSTALAESGRARVYVYTRALYAPGAALGTTGTWHISVFNVDGSLLWSRDFRPAGGGDPDDTGWTILTGRSAVGGLLHRGARRDVVRIYRQRALDPSCSGGWLNRYTFLDLLSGLPVRDIRHCVPLPTLQ